MKKLLISAAALVSATPAMAASGPFFSLKNTDFIVLIAFLIFVGILFYAGVPGMLGRLLDKRAAGIKAELDEARALREEAKSILASYERKQKEVIEQSDRIVASARDEARAAADRARADLKIAIDRRVKAAEEQIALAEQTAVRQVRERAVAVAVAAAGDLLAKNSSEEWAAASIDDAIAQVDAKLH
ncbi:F0F1 ATP synthase subunit B [Pseudogemmobacter bohemicus]|uniref:F0F1 ATP synthase subunit B n=1 Tax=Pseudogemmobacter bohemicus TaxID=2250708 RepID=UPI000DD4B5E7|nr:F0F1 ATP synthase subunit B [Pseudogemmobacter bohemicus]